MSTLYWILLGHAVVTVLLLLRLLVVVRRNRLSLTGKEIRQISYILTLLSFLVWELTYIILLIRVLRKRKKEIGNLRYQIEKLELDKENSIVKYDIQQHNHNIEINNLNGIIKELEDNWKEEKSKFRKYKKKIKESGQ